ncbi:MAG: acetyl esterase/lipase [Gammaproteobacteria bacterium]|jgi:acetyl esterase/lipase
MNELDLPAIYARETPPDYQPWPIYGAFLMAVATGEAPLVFNNAVQIPSRIKKTDGLVFKQADGRELKLDIYRSALDDTPRPLVVVIHGGYWKAGSRQAHGQQAIEFVDMGYSVASIDYRLSGQAPFPAAVLDVRDAIRWLSENAREHAIDASQIILYGSSAGGHLAAFMGLAAHSADREYGHGIDAGSLKAVISLYGMHDLSIGFHHDHPFTEQFIGAAYVDDPAQYREASPIAHAHCGAPPVLLMHGTIDGSVPVQHSDLLAARLKALGVPLTYDRIEGWAHCMSWFSPIAERTLWQIFHFLKQHCPSDRMAS